MKKQKEEPKPFAGKQFPAEPGKQPKEGDISPLGIYMEGKWKPKKEPTREEAKEQVNSGFKDQMVYAEPELTPESDPSTWTPEPHFKGDPTHAHWLLTSGETSRAILYAAEHGYNNWTLGVATLDGDERFGPVSGSKMKPWDDLDGLHKFGILSHVQSIVEDPWGPSWLTYAPHNAERKCFIALDRELRKALGFVDKAYE